ncbi:alpha-L-fucosidase [Brevundimonas sp.]|uniref:alpha-L-fucosidase n=1 Tax=Brevundimonas sp. TaxID=1871086 RepID=UPI002C1F4537|nr:alpha-L-fucosidase [Brevundimonas sp.]HWQ85420.1 alpha-L-fucosidase [Brevundimonas sp.]
MPDLSRRLMLQAGMTAPLLPALQGCATAPAGGGPAADPFQPTWESLIAGYRTPDWFRDAKLGIWAHWGPQCQPERGDWYGRLMYVQGNPFYEHHVRTYGHPSEVGFMEVMNQWKADNWDPEGLLDLYQAAGAKYVMAMAQHHDNLDLFESSHPWNSLRVGPKRDIVGTWEKLVRARGLRFGVSNHGAHAWHWWQTAYGYDAEGPRAGRRYDAARLTKADGVGKWWEGLDPQELYTGPTFAPPDGIASIEAMNAWHDARDGQWIETAPENNPAFVRSWVTRQRELVDRYRPDMVYFDNHGLPLGQHGLDATAYYYNASLGWRGELPVVNGKRLTPEKRRGVVETFERGFTDALMPEPWQTDTCIGDWHYNRARFVDHSYVPAKAVVQRLCDVVSKNGNLLLNIPMRGDGSIDSDERAILAEMAAWIAVNGEAIFASRPWSIYGEGPTAVTAGNQNEEHARPWTAQDIRFTTRGGVLYAIALDWPEDRQLRIRALGDRALAGRKVERVEMVGDNAPLTFRQTEDDLTITLPGRRATAFVPAFRIRGAGLDL